MIQLLLLLGDKNYHIILRHGSLCNQERINYTLLAVTYIYDLLEAATVLYIL